MASARSPKSIVKSEKGYRNQHVVECRSLFRDFRIIFNPPGKFQLSLLSKMEEDGLAALTRVLSNSSIQEEVHVQHRSVPISTDIDLAALGLPVGGPFQDVADEILDAYEAELGTHRAKMEEQKRRIKDVASDVERVIGEKPEVVSARDSALDEVFAPLFARIRKKTEDELIECYSLFVRKQEQPRRKVVAQRQRVGKTEVEILNTWMVEHRTDPHPTEAELDDLVQKTGMDEDKVNKWFQNNRNRPNKALAKLLEAASEQELASDEVPQAPESKDEEA
jgi:Homeobox KN domain